MAAIEEFDSSNSDEEKFENDWKFDDKDDIPQCMSSNTIPLDGETNTETNEMDKGKIESQIFVQSASKNKLSRMDLNTAKAGMEGLDKAKINQIIHEASKGSKFYENEKKKERQVQKRIQELQRKMVSFGDEQKLKAKLSADKIVEELEHGRDLSRTIVHVDMDAFYAAVEMRDDPSLKLKPMAVGGSAMLCTSNYLARRFGVRAGMPGFIAKKLCPNLTIVRTNFDKYTKVSQEIREVLAEYDRNFLPMSLDEAYLDITEYLSTLRRIEDSREQGMAEVTEKEMGKIERNNMTGHSDLDKFEIRETSAEANEDHIVERPVTVFKLGTGEIEATSYPDFGQETKHQSSEKALDVADYKQDGSSSDQHKIDGTSVSNRAECQGMEGAKDQNHAINENVKETNLLDEQTAADHREMFYNKVEEVVNEMRRKIEERTQLTASAGIAANMFLAKVCSDKNKPNGQFYLKPEKDKIMEFVRELPLRKAFGIGRVSEQILTSVLKVNTCTELHDRRDLMQLLFTPTACRNYLEISLGLGSTVVNVDRERKSMSTETTFREINKPEEHFAKCRELCQELSDSLKEKGLSARKIAIKLKTIKFEVKTRVSTSSFPIQGTEEMFSHAKKLLVNEIRACSPEPLRLRLMGVRAAEFCQKGIVHESKQQTIISLIKKSGGVPVGSANPDAFQVAEPSKAFEHDKVGIKSESVNRLDEVECSKHSSDRTLLEQPSTSKQYADDRPSFEQPEDHDVDRSINMDEPSSVDRDVPKEKSNTFECPVCGRDLTCTSGNVLLQVNQHVDKCLSTHAITDILKNDPVHPNTQDHQTSKKRKRESPYKAVKRRPMDRFLTKHTK